MSARRIGIMGGTFDPIHCGHIDLGRAAGAALGLTRLYLVPAHLPPHREPPATSAFHRFAMVALAAAGESGWQISDVELCSGGPSYTSRTLAGFLDQGFAPADMFFIIGADAFADIETWKDYPVILDKAHFAVVSRPGSPVDELSSRLPALGARMMRAPFDAAAYRDPAVLLIDAPTADVSSTAIRQRRAEGRSIAGLVVPLVQQHIERHGLYMPAPPHPEGDARRVAPSAGRLHDPS